MIKRLLRKIKFDININLVCRHENEIEQYRLQPLKHLIKECDLKSRYAREEVLRNESITNVKYYSSYALMLKDNIISRSIQEVIRIVDAKKAKR